jgi:hypothetical protein
VTTRPKRSPRRRSRADATSSPRRRKLPAPEVEAFEQVVDAEVLAPPPPPPAQLAEHEPEVPLSMPEPIFAARVPPPAPERPHPDRRRAIFFDVENTSRAEHIARVIEHLAVDRTTTRTEFLAVGNWRVIGHDTARLLARHGAQLVHSAPSVGVRDWSDLRIAVGAGAWLAAARAGDVIEIVSDDRAFDAVGDVAASLGIAFRRLSFRRLAGMAPTERVATTTVPEAARPSEPRDRHGRRRGRRGGRGRPHTIHAPAPPPVPAPVRAAEPNGEPGFEAHTAPHDEIVHVVQELIVRSPDNAVSIDTLANALKSRGFRRPPGSPRLITRLRRIREITIDRAGRITLVDGDQAGHRAPAPQHAPSYAPPEADGNRGVAAVDEPVEEPTPGNEREPGNERLPEGDQAPGGQPQPGRRRRRSRRGGRGRHRGRSGAPAAP